MNFYERNSTFIHTWGNWIIVISFILILTLFLISLAKITSPKKKVWTVLILLFLLIILTSLALVVNGARL